MRAATQSRTVGLVPLNSDISSRRYPETAGAAMLEHMTTMQVLDLSHDLHPGMHTHPGLEFDYVESGTLTTSSDGASTTVAGTTKRPGRTSRAMTRPSRLATATRPSRSTSSTYPSVRASIAAPGPAGTPVSSGGRCPCSRLSWSGNSLSTMSGLLSSPRPAQPQWAATSARAATPTVPNRGSRRRMPSYTTRNNSDGSPRPRSTWSPA